MVEDIYSCMSVQSFVVMLRLPHMPEKKSSLITLEPEGKLLHRCVKSTRNVENFPFHSMIKLVEAQLIIHRTLQLKTKKTAGFEPTETEIFWACNHLHNCFHLTLVSFSYVFDVFDVFDDDDDDDDDDELQQRHRRRHQHEMISFG